MSLFEESYTDVVRINETDRYDGRGGQNPIYTEGEHIRCAIMFDSSTQVQIAMKQGVTSVYTVTCPIGTKLRFHEILKRISDGQYFRITSRSAEKHTPERSSFKFEQATAERWKMP